MIVEKRLFPAQEKDERILLILRRHWFSYMIFWFMTILLLAPLVVCFIYAINNPDVVTGTIQNIAILVCSIYLLFILALLMNGFIDYYLDVYIITDRRVVDIVQNGLFKRGISELNLRQIQDVSAHVDGVFPTLLHYGNVMIQTAGDIPNFEFKNIPHPYEISKKILDLHEDYIKPGKSLGKMIKSTTLKNFGSEENYSKEICDNEPPKKLDGVEDAQKNKMIVLGGETGEGFATKEASKRVISKKKKTKAKPKKKVSHMKKSASMLAPNEDRALEDKVNGTGIDSIASAKEIPNFSDQSATDREKDEEGSLEEGKEIDLK